MSVDLKTRYLGLDPEEPAGRLRLSAGRPARHPEASGGSRRGGGGHALAVRGTDRPRRDGRRSLLRTRHRELSRGAQLLPRDERASRRRGRVPRTSGTGEARGVDPDHRQPQRDLPRGLAPLRQAHRELRRRCAGAECLLRRHRSRDDRRAGGAAVSRPGASGARGDRDPSGREDRPVLQLVAQHGPAALARRGGWPCPVQPLPPARHRPGDAAASSRTWFSAPATSSGCRCAGSRFCGPSCACRSRRPPASINPGTCSNCSWPGPT